MTPLAHNPALHRIRLSGKRRLPEGADSLTLCATGDGWSLIGPRGELVFHGLGVKGRRKCLEFAREHGVVAVFS
jgi:hypothetical protein